MNTNSKTIERIISEVHGLHQFFENWFNGTISPDQFRRFKNAISSKFNLITPRAEIFDSTSILELVKEGYNTEQDRRIWTENISVRSIGNLYLATYHELQEQGGQRSTRLSTALFSKHQDAPNGYLWEHVHETWINT